MTLLTRAMAMSFAYGSRSSSEPDFRSLPIVSVAGSISLGPAVSEPALTV